MLCQHGRKRNGTLVTSKQDHCYHCMLSYGGLFLTPALNKSTDHRWVPLRLCNYGISPENNTFRPIHHSKYDVRGLADPKTISLIIIGHTLSVVLDSIQTSSEMKDDINSFLQGSI